MNDLKKTLIVVSICIFTNSYAQIYQYTGKAWSLNTAINPVSSMYDKVQNITLNNFSAAFGASKMVYKGIYPTLSYTYNKSNSSSISENRKNNSLNTYNGGDFHTITSSVLVQKHLLTLQSRRINSVCFKQTMSIFFAPEYNYNLTTNRFYQSKGDFSVKAGICIFNSYSGTISRNIFWDFYYRKGLTPTLIVTNNEQSFYKDEIGVQMRILFRQRYDFSR
jgi:hypothetical protein